MTQAPIHRLVLPAALKERIIAEAAAALPRECCGLLEGLVADGKARILALHPARNLSSRSDRFEIDPGDQFHALRGARARGHAIIGCYHSHPGGRAEPSATDMAGASEEGFVWLIAAQGALEAFLYSRGGFTGLVTGADWVTSSR